MKRRRLGITNLIEVVVSISLFSILLILLITIMSKSLEWTSNVNKAYDLDVNTNYLIDSFLTDVKSSKRFTILDDNIILFNDSDRIDYKIIDDDGKSLYRNNELIFDNIDTYSFASNGNNIYMCVVLSDGNRVDINVRI